jgi:hypothetical protein
MAKYLPLFGLFFCIQYQLLGQTHLVFKLKPENRDDLVFKNSSLYKDLTGLELGIPKRKFPYHQKPQAKTNANGKALVDLSLFYEWEIPAPISRLFLEKWLSKRQELEYAEWEENVDLPLSYPNDPQADSVSGSQRQVLKKIMAYQAWNLSQGDTNVVIGILDTGTPVGHEDLVSQIKINPNDPPNGIDDDQNGRIDDYRGWDFGNNDNDPSPDDNGTAPGHGTSVSGLAAAAFNNAKGIAGLAGKCKILPLKIWRWNNGFSNFRGYDAIVYAADKGCKVINCSWGSARVNRQFEQEIINYATYNKDALVVAAGGNTTGFFNFLPANYDNVIGVSMTDTTDQIFWAASYHFNLDLTAPGVNVFGIKTDGSYGFVEGGSSMASPMVAGAAALVRSKFPGLNALQAGELLRVNSDTIYHITGNAGYRGLAGRGRLNMQKALEQQTRISLRAMGFTYSNGLGFQARIGDTLQFYIQYQNFLDSIPGFEAEFVSLSPSLEVLAGSQTLGPLASMGQAASTFPFLVQIRPMANPPEDLRFAIRVKVGNAYQDEQYFSIRAPLPMLDIASNVLRMTVVSNGRLGSLDLSNTQGSGIRFKNLPSSGDAGLMVGISAEKVSNCVFNLSSNDNHFKTENLVGYVPYFQAFQSHAVHHMNDSLAGSNAIGLRIKQSSFSVGRMGQMDALFLSYYIENRSGQELDSLCVGQYNDWDLENPNTNFCFWVDSLKMGVTEGRGFRKRFAATQLLTEGEPSFYAIDALNNTNNGNINLFNGFSPEEKWQTLSRGIGRPQAGIPPAGNNVVQVTGVKIRNFKDGEKRKVCFAYLLADSLSTVVNAARININQFRRWNQSPGPEDSTQFFCEGDTIEAKVSGRNRATNVRIFTDSLSSEPIYAGPQYSVSISNDTSFYVEGNDSLFAGKRSKQTWQKVARPSGSFSTSPILQGDSLALDSSLFLSANDTSSLIKNAWTLNGLQVDTSKTFSFSPDSIGNYTLCLEQTESKNQCKKQTCKTIKVYLPLGNLAKNKREKLRLYPNPAEDKLFIQAGNQRGAFRFFNVLGKVMLEGQLEKIETEISLQNWPPGLYFFHLNGKAEKESYLFWKR